MLDIIDFHFQAGKARISNHGWSERTTPSAAAAPSATVRRGAGSQLQPHRIHRHVHSGVLHAEHVILAAPVPASASSGPRLHLFRLRGFDFATLLVLLALVLMKHPDNCEGLLVNIDRLTDRDDLLAGFFR